MKIWIIGLYGAVATTTVVGAKNLELGTLDTTGLVSELPQFKKISEEISLQFDFGGHEIRQLPSLYDAALEHWKLNKHYDYSYLENVRTYTSSIKAKKGTALNGGAILEELGDIKTLEDEGLSLKEIVKKIEHDMKAFADQETVVINLASTEPLPPYNEKYHGSIDGFEEMIDEDKKEFATASMLYAYVSLKLGLPYGNFTPSTGSSIPALKQLALEKGVPHAGNDGKTGETLVKTTLAPMFAYRNLKILGWMGFNILGDYDGRVLNRAENKQSKVLSKDKVLEKILGYAPYTITDIRFFPSLVDNKTAFDFVHFQGFLGAKIKFYFIWDAVDAIVAAPLVLDIARFLLFAKKHDVAGVVKELALFFKSPMETSVIDTHRQFEILTKWVATLD